MKTKIIIFSCLSLFTLIVAAQSAPQIKDILVTTSIEIDSSSGLPINDENELLEVFFKVNDPSEILNVHILVGTLPNLGDIFSIDASLIENEGNYTLVYNTNYELITDNIIKVKLSMSELQYYSFNYITAYLSTPTNQISNILVFTK